MTLRCPARAREAGGSTAAHVTSRARAGLGRAARGPLGAVVPRARRGTGTPHCALARLRRTRTHLKHEAQHRASQRAADHQLGAARVGERAEMGAPIIRAAAGICHARRWPQRGVEYASPVTSCGMIGIAISMLRKSTHLRAPTDHKGGVRDKRRWGRARCNCCLRRRRRRRRRPARTAGGYRRQAGRRRSDVHAEEDDPNGERYCRGLSLPSRLLGIVRRVAWAGHPSGGVGGAESG